MNYREFMEKLRKMQRFYGVSLDALADHLDTSKSSVSRALRGHGRKWDVLERQKLIEAIIHLAGEK